MPDALHRQRADARAFARRRLPELAAELLAWHESGALPERGPLHELEALCRAWGGEAPMQMAEHLTMLEALRYAAGQGGDA